MGRRWARRLVAAVPAAALALGLAAVPGASAAPPGRADHPGKGAGGPGAPASGEHPGKGAGPEKGGTPGKGRFQPGAAGIGDPYFPLYGNAGYDVQHYLLDVAYDPATDVLRGEATITATATADLSRFNLDLVGMTVEAVTVDGKRAAFSRSDGRELVVTPQRKLKAGQRFEVVVRYSGVPTTFTVPIAPGFELESGFIHTDDGALVVGQPESAAAWFPVNDHPADAASYTFVVTVPTGLEVVANGVPVGDPVTAGATTTWTWEASEPMASYLTALAIGELDVADRTEGGLRVIDALDPDLPPEVRERVESSFARQSELVELLEGWFGPYPYDTVGGIVDDYEIFFALETQTRPIYSYLFWSGEDDEQAQLFGDRVVVHELAHQWFGDDLRLERWRDIWLNEGFATYAEWLFLEAEGVSTVQQEFAATYDSYDENPDLWELRIGDPGPESLFDAPVYDRGGMTLHALRLTVGDEAFFTLVRRWASEHAGTTVTTEEFIALAEEVSGQQLDALFEAWLYTGERPALPVGVRPAA